MITTAMAAMAAMAAAAEDEATVSVMSALGTLILPWDAQERLLVDDVRPRSFPIEPRIGWTARRQRLSSEWWRRRSCPVHGDARLTEVSGATNQSSTGTARDGART